MNILRSISGILLLCISGLTHSLTIVQMQTQLGVNVSDVYFGLYEDIAPNTVSNFLGYVNRGDYDSLFFHRKVQYSDGTAFVVQGGGFTYVPEFDIDARLYAAFGTTKLLKFADPMTGELGLRRIGETYVVDANDDDVEDVDSSGNIIVRVNDGLKQVPVFTSALPLLSEAALSNTRGTMAMALTSGPDTATNQWFVNLSNNTQLDTSTGGFTVFGSVLGSGIDFFDQVNNLDVYALAANVNSAFGDLPVVNYTQFSLMRDVNLVKVNSAREVINIDVTDHDFGYVPIGMNAQIIVTLTASTDWTSDIVISMIGDLEQLDPPYSKTSDCTIAPISPGLTCTITITFTPTVEGKFEDVLDISFSAPTIPNLHINVNGTSQLLPKVLSSVGNTLGFSYVYPDIAKQKTVTITNQGQQSLAFTSIDIDNAAYFSQTNNCVSLAYNETCNINVTLSMPDEGLKSGLLTIATNELASPFVISMSGTGSYTIIPDIDAATPHRSGDVFNKTTKTDMITVSNIGTSELTISSVLLDGTNASDFDGGHNCVGIFAPGQSCTLTLIFKPQTVGVKNVQIIFATDDPDERTFVIDATGTSSSDSDNIPDAEEDAVSNDGDGNNDSVKDRGQSNVVSFVTANAKYMTMATINQLAFKNVSLIDNPSPSDMPTGAAFDNGFVSYDLDYVPTTLSFAIGIMLPLDQNPGTFYQYGSTQDNPVPHWYEFMYDGVTGAQIFNNVTILGPDGTSLKRNFIRIWYADGQRGDNDMIANGKITSTIAISMKPPSGDSGGALSYYLSIILIMLITALRWFKVGRLVNNHI